MKYGLLLVLILGCTQFVQQTDDKYYDQVDSKTKSEYLDIVFSHNINGETHPCGCRNHPLGGIPQVAGAQAKLKKSGRPFIYIDSGDAFFPSPRVPKFVTQSLTFTADKIAESFDMMGLDYFVPGDQDFALGQEYLMKIANKYKFKFILTNASSANKIKHQKFALRKYGNQQLLFLGIVRPDLLDTRYRGLFVSPRRAIEETLKFVDSNIGGVEDMTVVLISHSGLDTDIQHAKDFKELNWVIGAHSQSYLRYTVDENKARIVQVLARNHYLGHIEMPVNKKAKANYKIIEMRDEQKDGLKPNPYMSWLDAYKKKLEDLQLKEQEEIAGVGSSEITPIPTAKSCLECHAPQTEFWQSTAHSLAYITLQRSQAEHNPSCVGCHSVGHKKVDGFTHTKHIVKIDKKEHKKYWAQMDKTFKKVLSPRKMKPKARKVAAKKWFKLDEKFGVTHNYANVQCLNCHVKAKDHPFEMEESAAKKQAMSSMCIKCHTSDQSPEWYNKDNKGIATTLNKKYFAKQLKKVACPKQDE